MGLKSTPLARPRVPKRQLRLVVTATLLPTEPGAGKAVSAQRGQVPLGRAAEGKKGIVVSQELFRLCTDLLPVDQIQRSSSSKVGIIFKTQITKLFNGP